MSEDITVHGDTIEVRQDPERRTLRQEVDELQAERQRQAEHIDALHRMIDQLVERVDALNLQVFDQPWHPVIARTAGEPLQVPLGEVRSPRRADRFLRAAAAVASEDNQRLAEASEDQR